MTKTFKIKGFKNEYQARLTYGTYTYGNNLYIGIETFDTEYNYYEPWEDLSTNLDSVGLTDKIYINYEKKNEITTLTKLGVLKNCLGVIPYNWNRYALYEVDLDKLKEYGVELK